MRASSSASSQTSTRSAGRSGPPGAAPGQQRRRRRASSSIERQALRRVAGIERHVGAAGLEDRRAGRRPRAPASARRSRPTRSSGPTPSARRWWASRFALRVQLRVGQPLALEAPPRPRPGVRAACASNSAWTQASGGVVDAGVVPFDAGPAGAPPREQRQLPSRCVRRRQAPRRAARSKLPDQAVDRRGVEQVGGVLERRRAARRPAPQAEREIELRRRPASASSGRRRRPGELQAPTGAFCRTNITWNSGRRARLRSGASSSTSFSNGTSWCA